MARNQLDELLADVSFVRWIREESTSREERYWNQWLQEDPSHKQLVQEAKNLLIAFQKEGEIPNIQGELEELEKQLDLEGGILNKPYTRFRESKENRTLYPKRKMLAMAAVFLIAAIAGLFTFYEYPLFQQDSGIENREEYTNTQEYRTDFGEKATFRLSDDSKIILNANSHIRFFSGIDEGQSITEVWLEGEAWFDITHFEDERRRTFTVHTDDGSVEVLGTRFAVKTFESETRAVLEEGKIQIRTRQPRSGSLGTGEQTDSTILQPGEMALFSPQKEGITLEKVNPIIYTSWNEDIWLFEDTPLDEVARRIEDTFGIEVMIQEGLISRKLSGSIKSTSLDVLAEALARILDVEIKQKDQKLFIGMNNISQS